MQRQNDGNDRDRADRDRAERIAAAQRLLAQALASGVSARSMQESLPGGGRTEPLSAADQPGA